MARVTVEDCIDKVSNRFELVLLAAHRARMISGGVEPSLDRDNDKNPVLALREIAVETVTFDELMESTIESHQRQIEVDEPTRTCLYSFGKVKRVKKIMLMTQRMKICSELLWTLRHQRTNKVFIYLNNR